MNKLPVGAAQELYDRVFGVGSARSAKTWATVADVWSRSPVPYDWRMAAAMWHCAADMEEDVDRRREYWVHLSECRSRYEVRVNA